MNTTTSTKLGSVFVTGASGFVGTHLVQRLRRDGIVVHAQARSENTAKKLKDLGAITFPDGDSESLITNRDLDDVSSMVKGMQGCDVVFHLAAKVDAWGKWEDFVRINVEGTVNVIKAAKEAKVNRIIHCSSESVLVGQSLASIDERTPYSPNIRGFYPRSKALAEQEALKAPGIETIIVRPRMIWGKGDNAILPNLIKACKDGSFKWIGGGENLTSTTHVANCVEGLILAAEKGKSGEIYFVTDGVDKKFREFWEPLLQISGVDTSKIGSLPLSVARAAAWSCEKAWTWLPLSGQPPVQPFFLDLLAEPVTVRDAKARSELGYKNVIDYERGVAELKESLQQEKKS